MELCSPCGTDKGLLPLGDYEDMTNDGGTFTEQYYLNDLAALNSETFSLRGVKLLACFAETYFLRDKQKHRH